MSWLSKSSYQHPAAPGRVFLMPSKIVTVSLSLPEQEQLAAICRIMGVNKSDALRMAIHDQHQECVLRQRQFTHKDNPGRAKHAIL